VKAILLGGLFYWHTRLFDASFDHIKGSPVPKDVHPQIQTLLDTMAALNLPAIQTLSVDQARNMFEGFADKRRESYPSPHVHEVNDTKQGAPTEKFRSESIAQLRTELLPPLYTFTAEAM
jgi:hypothetical protein